MPDDVDRDEQALLLRDQGRSFAAIARVLNLADAIEANAVFNRALKRHTLAEHATLRSWEMTRLDTPNEHLREREDVNWEKRARPSPGIQRLRNTFVRRMND
ncbi:MAG: hypothetical protein P4L20_02075 [Acidimicrobiales bacterium]|nr:hypothetical protein [Acidimicrobiales bacterium]